MSPRGFRISLAFTGALTLAACSFTPKSPGEFYVTPPPAEEARPGDLVRFERVDDAPWGAIGYRVVYRSTGVDRALIAVSGVVLIPNISAPSGGWDVVAWGHQTTGVDASCAPSMNRQPFADIPGLKPLIDRGYVVVASDYPGLGAAGPPSVYVGVSEAHATLDLIRAARHLPGATIGPRFAVWGHSQGGHAALFTGQLAASYAPDLTLVAVAAVAPPTDLNALFHYVEHTIPGNVVLAYGVWSWSRLYGASLDSLVTPPLRPVVNKVARDCAETDAELVHTASDALPLTRAFPAIPLDSLHAWAAMLAENAPGGSRIGVPILIAQGDHDPLVKPQVTGRFVKRLCAQGEVVQYIVFPANMHFTPGPKLSASIVGWFEERFTGTAAHNDCGAISLANR